MQRLRLLAFYESLQESESEKLGVIGDKLLAHFDENMAQLISVDQDFTSWKLLMNASSKSAVNVCILVYLHRNGAVIAAFHSSHQNI